jgi:hypothetical protein
MILRGKQMVQEHCDEKDQKSTWKANELKAELSKTKVKKGAIIKGGQVIEKENCNII